MTLAISDQLREQATRYLASCPGPHSNANNVFMHNMCYEVLGRLQNSGLVDASNIEVLSHMLDYRLRMMALATKYKNELGIEYPDCEKIEASSISSLNGLGMRPSKERARQISTLIGEVSKQLFAFPGDYEGLIYSKPRCYLIVMFEATELSLDQIRAELARLEEKYGQPDHEDSLTSGSELDCHSSGKNANPTQRSDQDMQFLSANTDKQSAE